MIRSETQYIPIGYSAGASQSPKQHLFGRLSASTTAGGCLSFFSLCVSVYLFFACPVFPCLYPHSSASQAHLISEAKVATSLTNGFGLRNPLSSDSKRPPL
ncbi:uncharacterized protein ACHE_70619S [Aspergillus chevalieri]|uniref:Uncharacterized protein n=1 Tax=Aspergillus chevalieri TaxID=182096 RepID=A0A7R7ZSF8_ASPCH|nr:uncharacterized protein ACHE_70619S [Aspergillus chevalieri]BCR91776.1 hypothetical protein ACHE_70619S [Aspergillus chevalieri]